MDQVRDMVPGDHWGFGGDLIRKATPEVGAQCQIPYYPDLSPYTGVASGAQLQLISALKVARD